MLCFVRTAVGHRCRHREGASGGTSTGVVPCSVTAIDDVCPLPLFWGFFCPVPGSRTNLSSRQTLDGDDDDDGPPLLVPGAQVDRKTFVVLANPIGGNGDAAAIYWEVVKPTLDGETCHKDPALSACHPQTSPRAPLSIPSLLSRFSFPLARLGSPAQRLAAML